MPNQQEIIPSGYRFRSSNPDDFSFMRQWSVMKEIPENADLSEWEIEPLYTKDQLLQMVKHEN